jgi:hypothetical protein
MRKILIPEEECNPCPFHSGMHCVLHNHRQLPEPEYGYSNRMDYIYKKPKWCKIKHVVLITKIKEVSDAR